jgi:hypothetical protein
MKDILENIDISHLDEYCKMAREGSLPADFSGWHLPNRAGTPIAYIAAMSGGLPKGFDQWDIWTYDGDTVAHEAARHGNLPPDFNQWDLEGIDGQTVKEVYDRYKKKRELNANQRRP